MQKKKKENRGEKTLGSTTINLILFLLASAIAKKKKKSGFEFNLPRLCMELLDGGTEQE